MRCLSIQLGEGALPSAQDDLEHEPAASGELLRRAGRRARRRSSRGIAAGRAPRHAHRARRHRQDPARPRSGARRSSPSTRRRLLGRARLAARSRPRHRDDRADARRQGRSRLPHRRARAAPPPRQPRAGDRGGPRARAALSRPAPTSRSSSPRRELLRIQGEVEYAVPPLAEPEAVSLFCERAQLEPIRRDRRAVRAPRLAASRRRARCRAHEGALAGPDPRASLRSGSTS